jgi:hypothetical protein
MLATIPRHMKRRTLLERLLSSRGASPWGTDLSTIAPTVLNANADVTLTADTTVTAIHSQSGGTGVPLAAINAFDTYPLIMGVLNFVLGATPPTSLVISYATTSGTAIASYTVEPGLLIALAELVIPIFFVGPASHSLYTGAGKDPLIQVHSAGQASTCTKVGSQAIFQLVLGVE